MKLPPVETVIGPTPIAVDCCLLLTLWVLANEKESFRSVAERFGVSESSAHRIFTSTVGAIHNHRHKYIVWPQGKLCQLHSNLILIEISHNSPNYIILIFLGAE